MSAQRTALAVDDEADQLVLLATHLRQAGYRVIEAASAEEALEVLHDTDPDLAIVDLLLPGMSGAELCQILRTRWPRCPVAVSSVLDTADYPAADATLPKPYNRAQVRAVLDQLSRCGEH